MCWIALLLALLSARFRDVPQLVANVVQVLFFLSPVLWKADMLTPEKRFIADFNPFYHLIELVRGPLLGGPINLTNWVVSLALLFLGSLATFYLFAKFRSRVPYWL